MHVDEKKRYDKRTIDRNLRQGVVSRTEYEEHLARLPDVSNKVFDREEEDNQRKRNPRKRKRSS